MLAIFLLSVGIVLYYHYRNNSEKFNPELFGISEEQKYYVLVEKLKHNIKNKVEISEADYLRVVSLYLTYRDSELESLSKMNKEVQLIFKYYSFKYVTLYIDNYGFEQSVERYSFKGLLEYKPLNCDLEKHNGDLYSLLCEKNRYCPAKITKKEIEAVNNTTVGEF